MSDLLQRLDSLWMNTESHSAASTSLIARDAFEQISYLERVIANMEGALELIAAPMRPDGTWNRDREACRQLAEQALKEAE